MEKLMTTQRGNTTQRMTLIMHNLLRIHWDKEERGSLILFRKLKDCIARWGGSPQHCCSLLSYGIALNLEPPQPHWYHCRSERSRPDFLMHLLVHPWWLCRLVCVQWRAIMCVQWRAIMHWRRRLCEEMRSGRRMFYVSIFLLKSLCIRQFHCSSGVRIYNFILSSLFILFISCVFPFMSSVIYGPLNVALNNTLFSI